MSTCRDLQPVFASAAIILATLMSCPTTMAQSAPTNRIEANVSDPAEMSLQWRFLPGENLDVEMIATTTFVDDQGEQFDKTEQTTNYRWHVDSLNKDGTANITVHFERVHFRSESPAFEYDSSTDSPMVPGKWGKLLYEQRALMHTQMELQVNDRGGVDQMLGADSINGPMMYTPGDWPALPSRPVSVGDTWSIDTGSGSGAFQQEGQATYTLARVDLEGKQRICQIEGTNVSSISMDREAPISITSVGRFDVETGRFIDEQIDSHLTVEIAPGERVTLHSHMTRRLSRVEERVVEPDKLGEYLFYFEDDDAHPLVVAGKRYVPPTKPVNRMIHLVFYHEWTDTNQDGQPYVDELADVTTRFTTEEDVGFVAYMFGLEDAKLEMSVIGSKGYLGTYDIPIKGNLAFAMRKLDGLAPGVFFLDFSVNDKHVVRVPVQVVGGDVRASTHDTR